MPPSIIELSEFLSNSPGWGWNGGRCCLAMICYVLKYCSNSDQPDHLQLIDTISRLNDLASSGPMDHKTRQEIYEILKKSFVPKVQKFFEVPNLQELSESSSSSTSSITIPCSRYEILVDFIHFLLQLLNCNEGYLPSQPLLQRELTFLLSFLMDAPFRDTQLNHLLLDDFEAIANDAGTFIYPFVLEPASYNASFGMEKVERLNEKIVEHCNKFPMMFKSVTPKSTYVDTFFIIDSLLEDLNHVIAGQRLDPITGTVYQIKSLHRVLMSTRAFLRVINAQQQQGAEIEDVKECLIRIRDLGYEAEYLINSYLVDNIPDWYLELRLPDVVHKFELMATGYDELKKISGVKVFNFFEELGDYEVKVLRIDEGSTAQVPPSHAIELSMVDDNLVGFDKETLRILDLLTGEPKNRQIISILGMSGLGKTTLARKIYNHPSVTESFQVRAWCVASQTYNKRKVLIDLLMSSPSRPDKETLLNMDDVSLAIQMQETLSLLDMDDESLATKSHKTLMGRRYLIVLDDVWSSEVWDDLRRFFPDNENGSRILFTSQIRDVVPPGSIIQELPLMSQDQCWKLLEKKVFCLQSCPSQLVETGKQITAKCNGLPLAVVVIAGVLLNMKKDQTTWKKVEECLDSYMSSCTRILELSYKHLPNHLKLCFLYLGVFPEVTEVPVKKLFQLWIAEGFIGKQDMKQEEVAENYLKELIDRSLVIIAKKGSTAGVKTCCVHDLLRDMCLRIARDENFLKQIKDYCFSTYEKHHRINVNSGALGYLRPIGLHCRSFRGCLSDPESCLAQMRLLRVLELSHNNDMDGFYLGTLFNGLTYLRYFVADRMPSPIEGYLDHLEFLRIDCTENLVCVTSSVLGMPKLKHFHARLRAKFDDSCDSSRTNNLETLSFVWIYTNKDYEILRASPNLRKLKCTCKPLLRDLQFLTKLESLKIEVRDIYQIPNNPTEIYLPSTIKKLSLVGTCLPWEKMPIIGSLPNLQVLKLHMNAFDGEEWETTNEGGFQELRFLKLERLKLKSWIASSEHFPKLQHLVLHKCKELQNIPTELGETLETIEVHICSYGASISAVQIEQEQLENGNEELKVIITNHLWSKKQLVQEYQEEN